MRDDNMKGDDVWMDRFCYSFPEVPDSFKKTVRETVRQNIEAGEKADIKEDGFLFGFSKTAAAIIICIFLIGGSTVFAFGFSKINQHLRDWGMNVPENEIISELQNKNKSRELLEIDDVYIDGTYLFFTGHLPEGAEAIPCDAGDHASVNGGDCYVEEFRQGSGETGSYFCMINMAYNAPYTMLDEKVVGSEVEVELSLILENTDDKETFSFHALIDDSLNNTTSIPDQTIEIEDGITAEVTKSTVSPSAIMLNIHFSVSGDNAEELLQKYTADFYYAEDSNGVRWENCFKHVYGGAEWYAEIIHFDMESDYIKLIPYDIEYDAQMDKWLYETAKADEEHAFIIKLK